MTPELTTVPVPLYWAESGRVLRVEGTRISIDRLVYLFQEAKKSPDEISDEYPTLGRAKVYAVIAYYLAHKDEVDAYVRKREAEAAALRREIEAHQGRLDPS